MTLSDENVVNIQYRIEDSYSDYENDTPRRATEYLV